MRTKPKISVVVPFYNVESFASSCLDSLLGQTFKPFEIICIDDGSSDSTGIILDSYAERDPRIRVFHFCNKGLSAARNRGVKKSVAPLISFVDGDDVVSPFYLESLYNAMDDQSSRFVKCGNVRGPLSKLEKYPWSLSTKCSILSPEEAIRLLLSNRIEESAWGCLAQRDVYERYPFPEGKRYEDLCTVASFFLDSESVAILDAPQYGYVLRSGSIVRGNIIPVDQIEDYFFAVAEISKSIRLSLPEMDDLLTWRISLAYARCYDLLNNISDKRFACETKETIQSFVKCNHTILANLARKRTVSRLQTIRILFMAYLPLLYDIAYSPLKRLLEKKAIE